MGSANAGEATSTESQRRAPRPVPRACAGLVIIGPTAEPIDDLDVLLSCPRLHPVEAMADQLADWRTATDEAIEVTRLASRAIRQDATAVVYLDTHSGEAPPLPVESREFVCARLGQIMVGLADVPGFVVLHSERMARSLIIDSLGEEEIDAIATTPGGFPVWKLTDRTMFPGVPVAACPGDRPVAAVADMVSWFQAGERQS